MRLTHQERTDVVRAENARSLEIRVTWIISTAKREARPLKQRELFRLVTKCVAMTYTQYQAAILVAVERGGIVAAGKTTGRRYTAEAAE